MGRGLNDHNLTPLLPTRGQMPGLAPKTCADGGTNAGSRPRAVTRRDDRDQAG
jgi:hypothetical protein